MLEKEWKVQSNKFKPGRPERSETYLYKILVLFHIKMMHIKKHTIIHMKRKKNVLIIFKRNFFTVRFDPQNQVGPVAKQHENCRLQWLTYKRAPYCWLLKKSLLIDPKCVNTKQIYHPVRTFNSQTTHHRRQARPNYPRQYLREWKKLIQLENLIQI